MRHRKKLLALGVAGIVAVAAAPYALEAWREREVRDDAAQAALWVDRKQQQLACLDRIVASGLPKGMNVEAEIMRCRQLMIDAETGKAIEPPDGLTAP